MRRILAQQPFATLNPARNTHSFCESPTGNFTLIGSVANLIVARRARAGGATIGFWAYFKVGAPLTILSILFGVWWL
jgi:Na+/H+ antiporter NhaD/arsenite permease-like protein